MLLLRFVEVNALLELSKNCLNAQFRFICGVWSLCSKISLINILMKG